MILSDGGKSKHILTGERTFTQHRSTLRPFTLHQLGYLIFLYFEFFHSYTSCSTINWGQRLGKAMPFPVSVAKGRTTRFLSAVIPPFFLEKIEHGLKTESIKKARFRGNHFLRRWCHFSTASTQRNQYLFQDDKLSKKVVCCQNTDLNMSTKNKIKKLWGAVRKAT